MTIVVGVPGTMHAVIARRRRFSVVQLERGPEARGAGVRNLGLVWVSGRKAGPGSRCAPAGCGEEIAAGAPGTGFGPAGSLMLACDEARCSCRHVPAHGYPEAGAQPGSVAARARC